MSEDVDLGAVAALLGDGTARDILTATSVEPMSATELGEYCDVSLPTAYRWTERLEDAGLIAGRTRPRADGHHDDVFVATLEELSIRLEDGQLEVEMRRVGSGAGDGFDHGEDRVDRLKNMWEEL